ncbi:MAG: hypothetical protein COV72_02970 [Candidatus Omnitrophica bacterium CG11_big_fil_rev_8_21_14_0_20_42_13]|uniref:N-acetyltransferase domain-containing protein n=1 Tax=Candidatus Ghiorseimicrobium undicola TaxID=1974746 RepID=A0A2H0M184_9BACT|nr:MAG: hypothetical protein COV72_02970 [Candidatus Omnitrophica bacterium CG11_big_fil_rev_8_21_14_0_20_42_13]
MIQLQQDIIKQKIKNIFKKDVVSIVRSIKNLSKKEEKVIDIYMLDLCDKSIGTNKNNSNTKTDGWSDKIQIKTLSKNEREYFEQYLEIRKDFLAREDLESILNLESKYFLALQNNQIAGVYCLVLKKTPIRGGFDLEIIFTDNQAYLFQLYVMPELRGTGLGSFLISYLINYCRNKAFQYLIIAMKTDNEASIHMHKKIGFKKYARIKVIKQCFIKRHEFKLEKDVTPGLLTIKTFEKKLSSFK